MFTQKWSTSERKFDVVVERDVKVPMPDGTLLDGNVYRPASEEKFPIILGVHGYNKDLQSPPMRPVGFTPMRGYMESGDSTFFARRGYVHAVFNSRGTGKSEGFYQLMGPLEVEDGCHLIDWLAAQPWSKGEVGMFGVSYYARLAKAVAAAGPKPLKAIFSPFAGTDDYRHRCYHGGILAHGFITHWLSAAKPQPKGRRDFTAETRSSQSSECILTKKLFPLRPPCLRGEPSDNLRMPRKISQIAVQ